MSWLDDAVPRSGRLLKKRVHGATLQEFPHRQDESAATETEPSLGGEAPQVRSVFLCEEVSGLRTHVKI